MNPTASIVILSYNNPEYTRQCLESIYAETEAPDFEVLVVDNASGEETRATLAEFAAGRPDLRLMLNDRNLGFAGGNNLGAAAARGEYLVFLNNDTVVTRGWLSGLIRHLQDPTVGMVGPVTNACGNESRIRVDYQGLEDMPAFASRYTRDRQGCAFEIRMLAFFCVALRRSVFVEAGPLDERFGLGMFEDDDYALRLKRLGYRLLCAEDVFVHHWGSAGFSKIGFHEYWRVFQENRRKFEDKWGQAWQPPRYRDELLDQQLTEIIDDKIYMANLIVERDRALSQLRSELDAAQTRLAEIENSRAWRLVQILWRLRAWLMPAGSRRERLARQVLGLLRGRGS